MLNDVLTGPDQAGTLVIVGAVKHHTVLKGSVAKTKHKKHGPVQPPGLLHLRHGPARHGPGPAEIPVRDPGESVPSGRGAGIADAVDRRDGRPGVGPVRPVQYEDRGPGHRHRDEGPSDGRRAAIRGAPIRPSSVRGLPPSAGSAD